MAKRILVVIGSVFISVLVLLGVAFQYRDPLVTYGANHLLAQQPISVTMLRGLQVSGSRVRLEALELALRDAGVRMVIANAELTYDMPFGTDAVEPRVLEVGSVRLVRDAPDASLVAEDIGPQTSGMRAGEILQMLRELPIGKFLVHELMLPYWEAPIEIELESTMGVVMARASSEDLTLTASLAQTDAAESAQMAARIETAAQTPFELMLTLTPTAEGYQLDGSGQIDVPDAEALGSTYLADATTLPLSAIMLDWDMSATIADEITASRNLQTTLGIRPGSSVAIPAGLVEGLGALALESSARTEFAIAGLEAFLRSDADASASISIRMKENSRLSGTLAQSKAGEYTLRSGFVIEQLHLQSSPSLRATFSIETQDLELGGPQAWLPQFDIAADLDLGPEMLSFSSELLLPEAPSDPGLVTRGSYDLASGSAQITATLPTTQFLVGEDLSLSAYVGGWPFPFDLMTGSLAAQVDLSWQPAPRVQSPANVSTTAGVMRGTIGMQLEDAAGYYGENFFRGIDLPFSASVDSSAPFPLSTPLLGLTVDTLDVGLALEDLVLYFQIDGSNKLVRIPGIQAEALGGTLHGEALAYQFDLPRNQLLLEFSGLRLENMLALIEYDGVAASGAVSGQLPLTITSTGIEVDAGTLRADEPGGSIKYLDAKQDGGNASLDLVNRALSDYQFESLNSTIDYRPDGELLLAMQLQGHNPNMNNGQRVNLNLTLSDNIPALLESLRARRAIEDFLEEKYQE